MLHADVLEIQLFTGAEISRNLSNGNIQYLKLGARLCTFGWTLIDKISQVPPIAESYLQETPLHFLLI